MSGPWRRIWLTGALLAFLPLLVLEACLRWNGFEASVKTGPDLWALVRNRVDHDSTVFVGTSRIMADLDPRTFSEVFGGRPPLQLGIPGGSPLVILEHLADDRAFSGTVVVDVLYQWIFRSDVPSEASGWTPEARANEYVQAYDVLRVSPAKRWETWLRGQVQSRLVFAHSELSPGVVLEQIVAGMKPHVRLVVRPDRHMRLRAREVDAASQRGPDVDPRQIEVEPALTEAERDRVIGRIARAVDEIRSRGGRVAFVHLPVSGNEERLALESYPRNMFWDVLVERLRVPSVNWEDFSSLSGYDPPDGEHLDAGDVAAFTRAFAQILKDRMSESDRTMGRALDGGD